MVQAAPQVDPEQPKGQEEQEQTPAVEEKGEEGMEIEEPVREEDGGEGKPEEEPQGEERGEEKEKGEREVEGEKMERGEEEEKMKEEEEGENMEGEGGEGEKMELTEDIPAHSLDEASREEDLKDSQPLREGEGSREDQTNMPPPLMDTSRDQPRPLMETRPAEPHPLIPPTSENKPRPLMEAAPSQPRPLMETNLPPLAKKPQPLMATKPPQVTSDYHSASDTPREEETVSTAMVNHAGPVANDNKASATGTTEGTKEVCSFVLHTK